MAAATRQAAWKPAAVASPLAAPPASCAAWTLDSTPTSRDDPTHPAIWNDVDTMVTPCGYSWGLRLDSAKLWAGPMDSAQPTMTGA